MDNMNINSGYVTIIGKPNAGKSTLMNALLGERLSIFSNKPQTTRKKILGIASSESYQIIFLDTPGILDPNYLLQERMLDYVLLSARDADLLIVMIDISSDPNGTKTLENEYIWKILQSPKQKKILLINKIDLANQVIVSGLIERIKEKSIFDDIWALSAISLSEPENLLLKIKEYLPLHPKYFPDDQLTDEPERFFVSEIIREKIFENYHEEIPFSTEVVIEDFKERPEKKDYISASIIVERESQKPIIIGKKGEMLKNVGQSARIAIEEFLQRPVYLELRVKVKPKWRSDEKLLKYFGYQTKND